MSRPDVLVVGAGLMGAATAWAARRRGLTVEVVDQHPVGHTHGSSHGHARIVRRGYSDPFYVELTGRAFGLWDELERATGTRLIRLLGGLDHGADRDVDGLAANLLAAGVPHEQLTATRAQERWPGLRFAGPVVFHAQAGTVDPDAAIRAMLGPTPVRAATVTAIEPGTDHAVVRTTDGVLDAGSVVLAAGGWLGGLVADSWGLPPLTVSQQRYLEFAPRDPAPPEPSVIHEFERQGFYHLAGGGAADLRKVGLHDHGPSVVAGSVAVPDDGTDQRIVDYVREWLPGLDPEPVTRGTCLYTSTPGEDFLVDRLGPVTVVSACSGHGAKFAPLIGEFALGPVPERFSTAAHRAVRAGRPVSL